MTDEPGTEPQPEEGPSAGTGEGPPDTDLQAEIEKWKSLARKHEERAEKNAQAAERLEEIEDAQKTKAEKAAEEAAEARQAREKAELEAARLRVALDKGLTAVQAKRLVGETEEELAEDADELLESFQQEGGEVQRTPTEKLRSGATSTAEPEETDPVKLAEKVPRPYS